MAGGDTGQNLSGSSPVRSRRLKLAEGVIDDSDNDDSVSDDCFSDVGCVFDADCVCSEMGKKLCSMTANLS